MKEFYPEGWFSASTDRQNVVTTSVLINAQMNGTILESTVSICDSSHNMIVNLGGIKGIIPRVEGAIGIDDGTTRDIALISRVGKSVCFTVSELLTDDDGRPVAILSRKNAQKICRDYFLKNYISGDIINAKITHLESFGAFCDIGCGNIALLPIDAISVSRISHPKDRFKVGDNIKAVIKNISGDGRITLSLKELLGTWEENADMFSQGQTVTGIIRSIEDYGIFVELTSNLAGLAEPRNNVSVGQQASVYIKSIIPEKMKIKLIIIDTFDSEDKGTINYFCDREHINRWDYSPLCCNKKIFTQF